MRHITLKEVGPRDGLQNEAQPISTEAKIELIHQLSTSGLTYIEATSFVSPKWMPQLADADEVMRQITRHENVTYAALVPNMNGLERALATNVDEVNIFMSASEGHNQANINKSIQQTYPVLREVVTAAKQHEKSVRAYISTVIACPIDGPTKPEQVALVADQLLQMGVDEISLGDTIGVGSPLQVRQLLTEMNKHFDLQAFAMHFHDTYGLAIANIIESLQFGITTFDSAVGGLGGCPYAKGATGNVATEDVVYALKQLGYETNVDLQALKTATGQLTRILQKDLASKHAAIWKGRDD